MLIDPISKRMLKDTGYKSLLSLMYHSITPGRVTPSWKWATSQNNFRDHLSLLQDYGWTTISSDDLYNKESIPHKSVAITFDDGYADNILGFDELTKRNMNASWFMVTKDIGYTSSWSDSDAPKLKLLDSSQLIEMQSAGMCIGSHTHTHRRLTNLSKLELLQELTFSKDILSEILKRPIISFAYPYGTYDPRILESIILAGYKVAFTTSSGFGFISNHMLEVRRVSIMNNDSLSSFARKLAFAANDVSWTQFAHYIFNRFKQRIS